MQKNHNKRYPDNPMLSLDQLRRRHPEWSGIEAIKNDMCANACIAYAGPFKDLQECPKCLLGRNEPIQYEASHGTLHVLAQTFYTIPLGPQLQVLWHIMTQPKK
jgi:hypothetical protein